MTTTVNIFYHQGLAAAPISSDRGRFSSDAVHMLQQPYLSSDQVSCTTGAVGGTSGVNAGPAALIARIEVQPGASVYYEVNPPGRNVSASSASPLISGNVTIPFGAGWALSFLGSVLT